MKQKAWNNGIKQTPESKKKQSESMKKRWVDKKYREKQKNTRLSNSYKVHMESIRIGENNPMYGRKIGKEQLFILSLDIVKLEKRYPKFCEVEDYRWNEEKIKIEVKCKFCDKWFIPKYQALYDRIRAIEHELGNGKAFLYCCDDHKFKCPYSNRVSPQELTKYQIYYRKVLIETGKSIKNNPDKIKNLHLRGNEYQLDHKYSIKEGFRNDINPNIIGHYENLEVISREDNCKKRTSCSININELLIKIG